LNISDSCTNNNIARVGNPNMESLMNSYNPFVCDFAVEAKKAKRMSIDGLYASIDDCRECIRMNINPNKYYDQISVYKAELHTRKVKVVR
jgi:hypothetical protein